MMVLVIGGSGSGKSAYAEKLSDELMGVWKYYLATMHIFDDESRRKVERHQSARDGEGFFTVEQPTDIHRALEKMGTRRDIILLECISNLTANEMFSEREKKAENKVVETVVSGVETLREAATNLIVVSNNLFEDGVVYDETTMAYMRAMGRINRRLAMLADRVVEVVAGIPIDLKYIISCEMQCG